MKTNDINGKIARVPCFWLASAYSLLVLLLLDNSFCHCVHAQNIRNCALLLAING